MKRFLQVFYTIFSAILLSYSIPNELSLTGSVFAGITALIPLYIALSQSESYWENFWLMGLHAFITHLLSSFWLANFRDFAIFTLGASALGTAAIAACIGLFMYVPYAANASNNAMQENGGRKLYRMPLRILWFPAVYTCWEWVKSIGFLAYPWGTVSMSVVKSPIIMQIADITGTYGITFIFAFFAAVTGEGINLISKINHCQAPKTVSDTYRHTATVCCSFLILSFIYGVVEYAIPRKPVKYLNTVLVQQNSDPWASDDDSQNIQISEKLSEEKIQELRSQGKDVDLVVWSEGVLLYSLPHNLHYYTQKPKTESLVNFIHRMNVPFIIGAPHTINRKKREYTNAAVLFDRNGNYKGHYGKIHLIPFAEVIPGADLEWIQKTMQRLVGFSSGWTAGKDITLFKVPCQRDPEVMDFSTQIVSAEDTESGSLTEKEQNKTTALIATPICFEDAFADICGVLYKAGCEVFINLTDDSWSLTDSAEYQHFVIAAFRAVEYRTTLVRSTNAGYSVVVTPAGKIIADMPLFKASSLAVSIPIYNRQTTIYARCGNWLPKILFFMILIYCSVQWYNIKFIKPEKIEKLFFKNKKKSKKK